MNFSKHIKDYDLGVPLEEAMKILTGNTMQILEDKKLIERILNNNIRIKGKMLTKYLKSASIYSIDKPDDTRKKVGVFIDYENISISGKIDVPFKFANTIINYASKFGNIVCKWACANFMNYETKVNLKRGVRCD